MRASKPSQNQASELSPEYIQAREDLKQALFQYNKKNKNIQDDFISKYLHFIKLTFPDVDINAESTVTGRTPRFYEGNRIDSIYYAMCNELQPCYPDNYDQHFPNAVLFSIPDICRGINQNTQSWKSSEAVPKMTDSTSPPIRIKSSFSHSIADLALFFVQQIAKMEYQSPSISPTTVSSTSEQFLQTQTKKSSSAHNLTNTCSYKMAISLIDIALRHAQSLIDHEDHATVKQKAEEIVSDENNFGVFNQLMKYPELFHAAVVFAHMSKYGQTLDQREYTDYYREVINETSRYGTNDGVKEAINIYSPTRRILNFKPAQATESCYDQSLMSLGLRPD